MKTLVYTVTAHKLNKIVLKYSYPILHWSGLIHILLTIIHICKSVQVTIKF